MVSRVITIDEDDILSPNWGIYIMIMRFEMFPDNQSDVLFDYLFPPLHVYYIIWISNLHAPYSAGDNEYPTS